MLPKSTIKGIEGRNKRKMGSTGKKKILRGILTLLFSFELSNAQVIFLLFNMTMISFK